MGDPHQVMERQLLVARVGSRLIGIAAAEIAGVLPMLPLWRPPTAPAPLAGFVSIGGDALPVISAHALLGLEPGTPTVYSHILRLSSLAGRPAGLLIDRAEDFATIGAVAPLDPDDSLNGCAIALFGHGREMAHLIDTARLLGKAEGVILTALTVEADRRRAEWIDAA